MSQTDPRAVARTLAEKLAGSHDSCEDSWYSCPLSADGCSDDRQEGCTCGYNRRVEAIVTALADAERRGMERAAGIAEMFSINKQQIHPDIAWENMSESAKTVCHMTCQNIACSIRAQAQADKEG